jgi:hypothetical protein
MSDNHVILYSHGFAVDKHSRGLFTDIVASLPGTHHILIDYNTISETGRLIRVTPIDEEVAILKQALAEAQQTLPDDGSIDVICHSQGCVIAALASGAGIRRMVLIAPPHEFDEGSVRRAFEGRRGVSINTKGDSIFARKDGVTAIVPAEYWPSLQNIHPGQLYAKLARETELYIISALHDELYGPQAAVTHTPGAREYTVDATHNFVHDGRQRLLHKLKVILA